MKNISYILTDIEGTTTSVSFVYDILFPYFRINIGKLKDLVHQPEVFEAFEQTIEIAKESEGIELKESDQIIQTLLRWSIADKKITPLKTLQGILWKEAYESGSIQGHVYEDVAPALQAWKNQGLKLGVFSSGSVEAQKLIFGYSVNGDLRPYFSDYFDTTTGGKREAETYLKISQKLGVAPENILFLSDISEELKAADQSGFQTMQLLRGETKANWKQTVNHFGEIEIDV